MIFLRFVLTLDDAKDCLDRTNVVEDTLSRFALEDFIRNTNPGWTSSDASLWGAHRILWAENGDALSRAYVGTNAINSSFTRSGKNSFAGLISNAKKSVGRMYQSNFVDQGKQQAIDALLVRITSLFLRPCANSRHRVISVTRRRFGYSIQLTTRYEKRSKRDQPNSPRTNRSQFGSERTISTGRDRRPNLCFPGSSRRPANRVSSSLRFRRLYRFRWDRLWRPIRRRSDGGKRIYSKLYRNDRGRRLITFC